MTQLEEADIFQVFNGNGGHVGHAAVALVVKLHPVLAQSDLVQPVFQRVLKHKLAGRLVFEIDLITVFRKASEKKSYGNVIWQSVWNVQPGDFRLQSFPMVWFLDADGCQVLWRHARNGGHVVARAHKQLVIFFVVEISKPCQQYFLVLQMNMCVVRMAF